jgi:peptidyl-dipeptidase Dcp
MKPTLKLLIILSFMINACTSKQKPEETSVAAIEETTNNLFYEPFDVPPFDEIKSEHFMPAFKEAIERNSEEIENIATNKDEPTFENTIAALDYGGEMLGKVSRVFYCLYYADTNDTIDSIAKEISPLLSEHNDNLYLNEKLFERVKAVYDVKDSLKNTEQIRLTEIYYKNFIRKGALLNKTQKERLREINKEIAVLEVNFATNVLSETNDFKLGIKNPDDLSGLPQDQINIAAQEAAQDSLTMGKWVFTLQKPSFLPFMQYADNRKLREKLFNAYTNRGNNGNEADNNKLILTIINLRLEKAKLLGYENHASLVLDNTMAKTPERAYALLEEVWHYALPAAKKELKEMQKIIDAEEGNFKLAAWDWWYYAEKLRKAKFELDEEELKPYFSLENVRNGAFLVAKKLWGLQFKPTKEYPVYHEEVEVFDVLDADGSHLGILYTDYFPRASKRAGAWMDELKGQYKKDGKNIRPIIINVGNFTKPTSEKPSLLTLDEVTTLFHELGHALHGLLSQCTYPSLSGTNVTRDFVELPSQIYENWATEPEVLKLYARHYQTNEVIPGELVKKIQETAKFNQGFNTVELLAAAMLDLEWHSILEPTTKKMSDFENDAMANIVLIEEIIPRYRSGYFSHIFSLGYDAGYYSYVWSEVLDADAFDEFKNSGDIFNQELARSYRQNILEKGNSEEPDVMYKNFIGHDPNVNALIRNRGLR